MVGRGNFWVMGAGQSLAAQRNGDGRVRVYASFYNTAEDWPDSRRIPLRDPGAARARLVELFGGWHPKFLDLLAACEDTIRVWPIDTLPVGLTWPPTPGVTLLGDAAHLMPPVGQGANMAMLDGALLALALVNHPTDWTAAINAYETEMFERTSRAARQSAQMQDMLASPDAGHRLLEFFSPT